jgi:hypothetical protein
MILSSSGIIELVKPAPVGLSGEVMQARKRGLEVVMVIAAGWACEADRPRRAGVRKLDPGRGLDPSG